MPVKPSQRAEINNFVKGLITEASPLNFPPNASADEENFELNRDGSRERRLGMDFENGATFFNTGIQISSLNDAGINSYKWIEVGGNPENEFVVIQFNQTLYFFDISAASLSTAGYRGSIVISSFPANTRFSFTSIEGFLVVAAGVDVIAKISYNDSVNSFSIEYDRILVRDVWGIQEQDSRYDTDQSFRGPLYASHYYNLQNQSWGIARLAEVQVPTYSTRNITVPNPNYNPSLPEDPVTNPSTITYSEQYISGYTTVSKMTDPVQVYLNHYGLSPGNSEQVWPGLQFQPVAINNNSTQRPFEQIFPELYEQVIGSSPKSARGYFIIDALRRGQSRSEKVALNNSKYPQLSIYGTSFNADYTPGGASIVAEFAGRVFYSGFKGSTVGGDNKSPNYSNYVFFSQLVKSGGDIVKCYQEGDPTSRDAADIVDTDGGFLRISEAKEILSIINLGTNLVAIATNGVWLITGGSDYGFTATNYKVTKLSNLGGISNSTVVVEMGRAYYWADDGIYTITRNQFGDYQVSSLTIPTIQKFYENIPSLSKNKAYGVYDTSNQTIRWLYEDIDEDTGSPKTVELIFDAALGAFYKHRIYKNLSQGVTALSLFQTSPYQSGKVEEIIAASNDEVYVGTNQVTITNTVRSSGIASIKYLSVKIINGLINFSFSFYKDSNFIDWKSVDNIGQDAKAFCLTGAQTAGDSSAYKQIPYLVMHFRKTEDSLDVNYNLVKQSSCLIRGQWDFANTAAANKWTPLMQAYRIRKAQLMINNDGSYDNGYELTTSKTKLRGRGRAFALYFETEPLKDCQIVGWSITVNGNSAV